MRLLPCLAALVLATTTVTTQIASACGGSYAQLERAPHVMLVSSHTSHAVDDAGQMTSRTRAFALLASRGKVADSWLWELVAPRSYDATRMRSLGRMPSRTLTLIGPSGSRVVSVASHVELAGAFFKHDAVHDAVELPVRIGEDFEIAIEGAATDAKWHDVQFTYSYTSKIGDTSLAVTTKRDAGEPQFSLRAGKRDLGTYRGRALGAFDVNGSRYVVISADGVASAVEVPMT